MKIVFFAVVGLVLGAIVGGVVGVGAGLIWTTVFNTTSFEGYSGMLVFLTFMPVGAVLGALVGAAGLITLATRSPVASSSD